MSISNNINDTVLLEEQNRYNNTKKDLDNFKKNLFILSEFKINKNNRDYHRSTVAVINYDKSLIDFYGQDCPLKLDPNNLEILEIRNIIGIPVRNPDYSLTFEEAFSLSKNLDKYFKKGV